MERLLCGMPEGPELHMAGSFVNRVCCGLVFSGSVEKSAVSKNMEVPFQCDAYIISAQSRGKEVKLTLTPVKQEEGSPSATDGEAGSPGPLDITFRFGMSGSFQLAAVEEIPKHAHLRFLTSGCPRQVLCFVDPRRFGSWAVNGSWQPDRGPCVLLEYEMFRQNVLSHLSDNAFNKPICEVLLNQRYFNGIGNYLRAEILHRLKVPPFERARTVLEASLHKEPTAELTLSKKVKVKLENPDILELCHLLPMEVINLGGKGYNSDRTDGSSAFAAWLRCYDVSGMQTLRDANGRTIWFQGSPGPMAPKGSRTPKAKSQRKTKLEEDKKHSVATEGLAAKKRKGKVEQQRSHAVPEDGPQRNAQNTEAVAGEQEDERPEQAQETRRRSERNRRKPGAKSLSMPETPAESGRRKTRAVKSRNK